MVMAVLLQFFVMVSCGGNFHLLLSWSVFMIILIIWVYIVSSFLCKFVILELCVCVCRVLSFFLFDFPIDPVFFLYHPHNFCYSLFCHFDLVCTKSTR